MHNKDHTARLETLEPRLLLASDPVLFSLFESAQVLDVQPLGSVAVDGEIPQDNDMQMYRLTAPALGTLEIDMSASDSNLDSVLEIYNEKGRRQKFNDNAADDTLDSNINFTVRPEQTYYVLASANNDTRGEYQLSVASKPRDDHGNTIANARSMKMSRRGRTRGRGKINFDDDVDMMSVISPTTAPMVIQIASAGRKIDINPHVAIYDTDGNLLAVSDAEVGSANVTLSASAGQTYYIQALGDYVGRSSRYRLQVDVPIDDYGSDFENAGEAWMNSRGRGRARGSINWNADVDMLQLTATVTGQMQVDLSGSRRSDLDPVLYVYDTDGTQLAYDDDSGEGLNARATFDVVAGQTYYLKAQSYAGSSAGKYSLTMQTTENVDPTPSPEPDPDPAPEPDPDPQPDPQPDPDSGDVTPQASIIANVISEGGSLQLRVVGTDGDDTITLSQTTGTMTLTTGSGSETYSGAFESVLIYGFGGTDTIRLMYSVTAAGVVYAGAGDDMLYDNAAGQASLYGGTGNDLLVSVGGGSDTLFGQDGLDSFWMDSSDAASDVSSAESAAKSVHTIGEFYQPYSTNPNSSDYVSLQITGQDLLDPTPTGYAASWANFAHQPLFSDGPDYNDVRQGAIGDCYFLAVLASLSDTDPTVIRQMVTPFGDGTYGVRFYNNGQEVYLRLDADLPVNVSGSLAYAKTSSDGEIWVPIVEKAFTYFRYGQNSYSSINGGWMSTTCRQITGEWTNTKWTSTTASDLYSYFSSNLSSGYAITLGSNYDATSPVVSSHAYMVKSVQTVGSQKYVTVYNPWGWDGATWDADRYDGLLELTIQQVQENFSAAVTSLV